MSDFYSINVILGDAFFKFILMIKIDVLKLDCLKNIFFIYTNVWMFRHVNFSSFKFEVWWNRMFLFMP